MKTPQTTPWRIVIASISVLTALNTFAFLAPKLEPLPNFDRRATIDARRAAEDKHESMIQLHALVPKAQVDFDEHLGTPSWIIAGDTLLSGEKGKGGGITAKTAAAFPDNEPHRPTKAFLKEHKDLFGFGPEILVGAKIKREFVTEHNGLKTVVWEQELDGISIFEGLLVSHTTKKDELVNISSHFLPNPAQAAQAKIPNRSELQKNPTLSAAQAIALAAKNLGENLDAENVAETDSISGAEKKQHFRAEPLNGDSEARLVWLPMDSKTMVLCWEIVLTSRARGEMYRLLIDVQTGDTLARHCLTEYISDATYNVYTSDSPSPFSPGHPTPLTSQPPLVSRTLVTLSALDTNASPNGWINDGNNETVGNNVDAHLDRDNNNLPDLPRPQGSPFRTFDVPLDLTQAPTAYTNAAAIDLFYWCNWIHDKYYALGFTEAAGNFQTTNFNRGGLGNDALQADAQDGSGVNNANMSTPSDGSPPRMQMYVFTGPTPDRDGDLDHEIVIHEFTHGLSNRRVGGGVGLSASQSTGMGEGWSDWYGLTLLSEAGDNINGNYAAGGYATLAFSGLPENYYYGIRRYPYSTDMTKNPLTFKDIDPGQISPHTGIPRSSAIGNTANEVHNQGEVWCVTLWEARANLITKYGFATGNQMILQLVTDGMNLSPANPTFLQARNGILQADVVNNGGANQGELWTAFAKRGMGSSATSPSSSTTTGVVEAYDIPDNFSVNPATGLTSSGNVGGPFTPVSKNFTLVNIGTNTLNWSGASTVAWLTLSQTNGVLNGGGTNILTVSINTSANSLPAAIYNGTIRLTNVTSGIAQTRSFVLRVGQPDYFTELFDGGDNDLDNQTLTFTPNGSTNFYSVCREPAFVFPTPTNGATNLALLSHSYLTLNLTTNISIYGRSTNIIFLASEGRITLNAGDSSGSVTLANHFSLPRISAFAAHTHPTENGGIVSWMQISNRVVITFNKVVEYGTTKTNSFQMELFYDGRLRMTHLDLATTTGLVGLSAGNGTPAGFIESDLSSYGPCSLPMTVNVPTQATEGDGTLIGQGQINIFSPAATNVTVNLSSSDTSEVTVPASVTILAGQTTTNFDVTVIDDAQLDGTQVATITATSPEYSVATDAIQILDNETATLSLSIPQNVTEGSAPVQGTVFSSAAPSANITVDLSSSDTTDVQVPSSVVLLAGQTSASFNITVINDIKIEPSEIVSIGAQVPNWINASANITVQDNESTNIVVVIPSTAREGNGLLPGAGQVRIFGTLATNLPVSLLSSDTSELTVPSGPTILAGQTNVTFNLTVVDDVEIDGPQTVTVTASAAGLVSGATNIVINDDESPPIPTTPSPVHLATNVIQTADLAWQSGAAVGEIITNDVYFGTNPVPGPGEFVGTTTSSNWALPNLLPLTTYYWQIVARKAASVPGPIWQFTTRGVDHFVWNTIASPQYVSQPFNVTITAKDVYETTVSNFTGAALLRGSIGGLAGTSIEDFESGTWPHAPWVFLSSVGTISPSYKHDGVYGLSDPEWSYRTNVLLGNPGDQLSWWVRPSSASLGRAYLGFGASAAGCWSIVTAANTGEFILQQNSAYQYLSVASVSQPYQASKWYKVSVAFGSNASVVCNLYDSDGLTLLNTIAYTNITGLPGGIAMRSFDGVSLDSITAGNGTAIAISPTNTTAFANGLWTGNISVLEPAIQMTLRADDNNGHIGSSNPFDVQLQNDIAVSLTDSPDPVSLGGNVTYLITVTNIGPNSASNVTVSNILPATASFVSATNSQGTGSSINNGTVICNLNTLTANSSATVTIVATATNLATLTNRVFVSRSDSDSYLSNNTAFATTVVQVPTISINDVSLFEGNSGTANATFTVTVTPPPVLPVSVNFTTANGTAITPGDFTSTNGTLNFAAGETNKTIIVRILGDAAYEADETFAVNLSGAINANFADGQGIGTIRNDDAIPTLSISDVFMNEGNSGSNSANFSVTLSAASGSTVSFNYATVSGNATSGTDYVAKSGSLTIPAGVTNTNISVTVFGDLTIEPDEVFYVDLSSPANANLLKREGIGLIINDDGLPGEVDHFVWNAIAPTQYVGQAFGVIVAAQDAFNNPATNFNNTVSLSGLGGAGLGTNTILASPVHTDISSGNYTLGHSFTPTNTLTVTHVRSYFGTKVSIWTDAGTLLASQSVSGSPGTWTETPLTTPIILNAGSTYRIGAYTAGGNYYWRTDGSTSFPNGSIVQSYNGSGDSFPTSTDSARWWFVDLRYTVGAVGSIPITPTVSGAFVNGFWTGSLTVLAPATNLVLRASDTNGHSGTSSSITAILQNDIALSMTDSPDPVAAPGNVTYLLTVTNIGPNAATSVVVSNLLPASASLVSVTASQGTTNSNGSFVICNLGTMAANTSATITIVARANSPGTITNSATVYRGEADALLNNNSASTTTTVQMPSLSIGNASVAEGNSGSTQMVFTVALSLPVATNVTVNFATANGTASAGSDYTATNGALNFAIGQTNQTIAVQIFGDTNTEPSEIFSIILSNPVNASIATSVGTGTILNDEVSGRMAVLGAPSTDSWNEDVRQKIAAAGNFSQVDGILVKSGYPVPTLLQLQQYGAVLVYSDAPFNDGTSLGNVLADYVDAGGGVVICTFAFGGNLQGRLVTGGYLPLVIGSQDEPGGLTLVKDLSGHDILSGVNSFNGGSSSYHNTGGLNTGAIQVGHWSNNRPLIATKETNSHRVVGLNFYPPSSAVRSDFWSTNTQGGLLMANALQWASYFAPVANPPVISQQPISQSVVPGGTATFNVMADGAQPFNYQWRKQGLTIPGATNINHSISNVVLASAGNYDVIVGNSYGSVTSSIAVLTVVTNAPVTINFDEISAPCGFFSTELLTNRYASLGVIFSGPNSLDGGAILNECGAFGVTGHTPPNFLAFNSSVPFPTGGYARGPETLNFSGLVSSFQMQIGSSQPGVGTLVAYNTNNQVVASNSVTILSSMQTLSTVAPDIARVVISCTSPYFVVDNITFQPVAPPAPPQLKFRPMTLINGILTFAIAAEDGSPLTSQRASNIWIYTSTNLSSTWNLLNITPVLTNGILQINGLYPTNGPTRFFRAAESP